MRTFLLFTLYAPLAAMGDVAVGERRTGLHRPARSAILGLVAAALGVERRDEAAHAALERGYGLAVRVDRQGTLLQDYHTAQVPPARKGRRWSTRRAELAEPALETILSLREYRTDTHHTVALWERSGAPYTLARLEQALKRPRFTLYFGRKACPLGLPPAPRLVEAATLGAAFEQEMPQGEGELRRRLELGPAAGRVHADAEAQAWLGEDLALRRVERRRDVVVSRRGWRFGLREELVAEPTRRNGYGGETA